MGSGSTTLWPNPAGGYFAPNSPEANAAAARAAGGGGGGAAAGSGAMGGTPPQPGAISNQQPLDFANYLYEQGRDPNQAGYKQAFADEQQATNSQIGQMGLGSSPLGAGIATMAGNRFQNDWQTAQVDRAATAANAYTPLYNTAQGIAQAGFTNSAAKGQAAYQTPAAGGGGAAGGVTDPNAMGGANYLNSPAFRTFMGPNTSGPQQMGGFGGGGGAAPGGGGGGGGGGGVTGSNPFVTGPMGTTTWGQPPTQDTSQMGNQNGASPYTDPSAQGGSGPTYDFSGASPGGTLDLSQQAPQQQAPQQQQPSFMDNMQAYMDNFNLMDPTTW